MNPLDDWDGTASPKDSQSMDRSLPAGTESFVPEASTENEKELTEEEIHEILKKQDSRKVSSFEASKLEREAKKNWDVFYKRNETRFFKDRHWTLREFQEILGERVDPDDTGESLTMLEIGCGVGNFAFPILEEIPRMRMWVCDFSPRAIDLVKSNPEYNEERIQAFVCDITEENCFSRQDELMHQKVDFISLIFVLSAICPEKHGRVLENIMQVAKVGTIVCFRDYGRYDMAQLRFKGGKKIQDNFYVRRDGTRAYYFTPDELRQLFLSSGKFKEIQCDFVHRRTVNLKENVNVGRIFVQAKFERVS